jgi:hypothetical protein
VAKMFTRGLEREADGAIFAPNLFIIYNVHRGMMVAELLDLVVREPCFLANHELSKSQRG